MTARARRAFFAEDNPDHSFLIRRILINQGLESVHAATGDEAVRTLEGWEGEPPVLILVDHGLPGRSGLEVLDQVRSDPRFRAVPIALFSSSAVPASSERILAGWAAEASDRLEGLETYHLVLSAMARHWTVTGLVPEGV